MCTVLLTGWNPGFNKVKMTKLLREKFSYSLGDAKKTVDSILENQQVTLVVSTDVLDDISSALKELGLIFSVEN